MSDNFPIYNSPDVERPPGELRHEGGDQSRHPLGTLGHLGPPHCPETSWKQFSNTMIVVKHWVVRPAERVIREGESCVKWECGDMILKKPPSKVFSGLKGPSLVSSRSCKTFSVVSSFETFFRLAAIRAFNPELAVALEVTWLLLDLFLFVVDTRAGVIVFRWIQLLCFKSNSWRHVWKWRWG